MIPLTIQMNRHPCLPDQDGCVKVFQRLSSLEKHLSLEKCTKSLEKRSLLDLAKLDYKSRLEEGTTSQVISFASFRDTREATSGEVEVKEGWALKPSKNHIALTKTRGII